MRNEHASISAAEFEARGLNIMSALSDRFRVKAMEIVRAKDESPEAAYRSDGDVGVFSIERHDDGVIPKYGLITEVPRVLIYSSGDDEMKELRDAPFELRAAMAACHVMEKMILAEAIRLNAAVAKELRE